LIPDRARANVAAMGRARRVVVALAAGCGGLAAAGCGGVAAGPGPDGPDLDAAVNPATCPSWLTLDGAAGTGQPTPVGPVALDGDGVELCLHLDARANRRVHFAAWTDYRDGAETGWASRLFDDRGAVVRDGWDVVVGDPPRAFLNLEWSPPAGQVTDVVLHVWAAGAAGSTPLYLALFDPLE